jgi:hypothetical protein
MRDHGVGFVQASIPKLNQWKDLDLDVIFDGGRERPERIRSLMSSGGQQGRNYNVDSIQ